MGHKVFLMSKNSFTAFPKAKYFKVHTEFQIGSKFNFSQFLDKSEENEISGFILVFKSQTSKLLETFTFKTSEFFQTKCKKSGHFSRHFDNKRIKFFHEIYILLYLSSMVPMKSKYITPGLYPSTFVDLCFS